MKFDLFTCSSISFIFGDTLELTDSTYYITKFYVQFNRTQGTVYAAGSFTWNGESSYLTPSGLTSSFSGTTLTLRPPGSLKFTSSYKIFIF